MQYVYILNSETSIFFAVAAVLPLHHDSRPKLLFSVNLALFKEHDLFWKCLSGYFWAFEKMNSSLFISYVLNSHRCPCLPPASSNLKPLPGESCMKELPWRPAVFSHWCAKIRKRQGAEHRGPLVKLVSGCAWKTSHFNESSSYSCLIVSVSLLVNTYR